MPNFGPGLNNDLFKYRKRRKLSLDGTVAGLAPSRASLHVRPATPYGHGFTGSLKTCYQGALPQQSSVYDPSGAFYEWPQPNYEEPVAGFEHIRKAPDLVREWRDPYPPDSFLRGPAYIPMTEDMMEMALDEVRANGLPPGDETQLSEEIEGGNTAAENDFATRAPQAFEPGPNGQMTPEWDAMQEGPEPGFEADLDWGLMQSDQSHEAVPMDAFNADPSMSAGLEAIVEAEMIEEQEQLFFDPNMDQQDPYAMQRIMEQYDEQMLQLMNPFMMPGPFGPGPSGP